MLPVSPLEDDPEGLAWLLQGLATRLPTPLLLAVMRHLPCVVVARLACVHKAYLSAWQQLRMLGPAARWDAPSEARKALLPTLAPLTHAAWLGDDAAVARLLARRGDVLEAANDALVYATLYGHDIVVAQLLAAGADVHVEGEKALQFAARCGHDTIVAQLLAAGADVHASDGYECACVLGSAALEGHDAIVARLLAAGANVHAWGDQALRVAALRGHDAVVARLLAAGADVHVHGDEALRLAAENGHAAVVARLRAAAGVHAQDG